MLRQIQEFDDENAKLKMQILEFEKDLADTKANYERDKALWFEKHEFLQNQKKQAKEDLKEAH